LEGPRVLNDMITYVVRRLIAAAFVVFLVTLATFFVMRLIPGDPLQLYMSGTIDIHSMAPEKVAALRHEFGLDKPVALQYLSWVGNVARGNLGTSLYYRVPVRQLIAQRYPVTLYIGFLALLVSTVLGLSIGLLAALRRGKWQDTVATSLAYLGQAVPVFWLGILLIYVFNLKLHWLPTSGWTSPFENLAQSTRQLIMPLTCLSITTLSATARQMRSSMLEVIRQDYIRTAWSKGLSNRDIVVTHALKNSLIPVVTLIGLFVPWIFGGSVFVETIFAIPGIGRLLVESILGKDYVVVQSVTLIIALIVVLTNVIVDVSYRWIDPRIRFS
jgi:peptide/nickel transport system permease protein